MDGDTAISVDAAEASRGASQTQAQPQGDRPGFIAFVAEETSEAMLRGGLPTDSGTLQFRRGDVRTATRALGREATPSVLLVDISGIEDPVGALVALAAVCTPDVRVLVIGEQASIGFYRQLTRDLGVTEYLYKPLTRDTVAQMFGPQVAAPGSAAELDAAGQGGKVIVVCGVRGGCGATTVAVNLSLQLAEISRGYVALLDLHLRGGTAGMMLGVRPGTGLRVALEEPDRVDSLFLDRAGIPIEDRLRLIAAEEPMDSMPQPAEVGVQRVLEMLRYRSNYVVVDLPMPPGPAERIALATARHCILVLGPDIAGIRDTLAMQKLIGTAGGSRTTVVLNRAGMPGSVKPKLIEEGLGAPPDVVIPDLPRQLPRAANLGRPALRDSTALRRALTPLMREIAAVQDPKSAPSLFSWLLGRHRA